MNIKHWMLALALGGIALTATSCKKDDPQPTPSPDQQKPAEDKTPEALRGTWTLSNISVSPATVEVEGKTVDVKEHIFDVFLLGQMGTPTKLVVEKGKATFSGAYPERTFAPEVDAEGKLTFRYPIGELKAEGGKLHARIEITNKILKAALAVVVGRGTPTDPKQDIPLATKVFAAIASGTQDLKITLEGTK